EGIRPVNQGGHGLLRIDASILGRPMSVFSQVERDVFVPQSLEIKGDPDAKCRGRTEISIELYHLTPRQRSGCAAPQSLKSPLPPRRPLSCTRVGFASTRRRPGSLWK